MKKQRSKKGQRAVSNKHAGRAYQRKVAKMIGGKNVGTIEGQDVEHRVFSVEAKKVKTFKRMFGKDGYWTQTMKNTPEGKIPLLFVHLTGSRHEDDLITMCYSDWRKCVSREYLS